MKITLYGKYWETPEKEAPFKELTIEPEEKSNRVKIMIKKEYVFIDIYDIEKINKLLNN